MKFLLAALAALISFVAFSQADTLTIKKHETGFLFMSEYNHYYDSTWHGHVVTFPTFSDFFFPSANLNYDSLSTRYNKLIDGVRLYHFSNRQLLKKAAKQFLNTDTTMCYPFESFYLIPIEIEYELSPYNDVETCRKSYFDVILPTGTSIRFNLMLKSIYNYKIKLVQ